MATFFRSLPSVTSILTKHVRLPHGESRQHPACASACLAAKLTIAVALSACCLQAQTDLRPSTQSNFPVPSIGATSPVSATPGGGDFTLTVMGNGFVDGASVIYWNGSPLPDPTTCQAANPGGMPPTFVESCSVTVRAANIANPGTAGITVVNPDASPLDGTSNVAFLPVATAVASPVISSRNYFTTQADPNYLAVGDFNGDGNLDLAVSNRGDNNVTILLGDGKGDLTPTSSAPTVGKFPQGVVMGDFNGDAKQDLAVVNYHDNNVSILLGDGTGNFSLASSPATGHSPVSLAAGDFNGDGNLDLAVVNSCPGGTNCESSNGSLTILLGDGTGNFSVASSPSTGFFPTAVAAGDFNGDGNLDLAVVNSWSNDVTILLGDGTGNFTATASSPPTGQRPQSLAVGDFNGDGKLDLAVANYCGGDPTCNSNGSVTILLGDGDGTFTPAASAPGTGYQPSSVVAFDFNGDGKLDLAVSDETDVTVLLGDGGGHFASATPVNFGAFTVAAGDFNGDGRLDLAALSAAGGRSAVLLQTDPNLTITKSHVGQFSQGQTGAAYTITVSNSGAVANIGTVTVTDTLPTGLTATAMSGGGWNCSNNSFPVIGNGSATVSCTRSDPLAAGASYAPLTLTVNVAANAPTAVTNTAEVAWSTGNYTVNDPTTILQAPTPDSVSPSAASNANQTFTLKYSSRNGRPYTDLTWVFALFKSGGVAFGGAHGCYVLYHQTDNSLFLENDGGNAELGPLTPGSAGRLSNSQCTVNGTGTTVTGSGATLSLNLSVTATSSFVGAHNTYLRVQNSEGSNSGWRLKGTWTPRQIRPPRLTR